METNEKSCLKPMPVIGKPPCQMQSAPASKSQNSFPTIAGIKRNCTYPYTYVIYVLTHFCQEPISENLRNYQH